MINFLQILNLYLGCYNVQPCICNVKEVNVIFFPLWIIYVVPKSFFFYRHSLSVAPESVICPSLSLSLLGSSALSSALSVCPVVKAYISVTMSLILMKLGESVGT